MLAGKLPADLGDAILKAIGALDQTTDMEEKANIVRNLAGQKILSPELEAAFFGALMREEITFEAALLRARKTIGAIGKGFKGERMPRETEQRIDKIRRQLLIEFAKKAQALLTKHPAGIPKEELNDIRRSLELFDKGTFNFIRGRMGSSLLEKAEMEPADAAGKAAEEITGIEGVIFGEEQAGLMRHAYELYRTLRDRAAEKREEPVMLERTREGAPRADTDTFYRLARAGRRLDDTHKEIPQDRRAAEKIQAHIAVLENFVLRYGRADEIKEEIRNIRAREADAALFEQETKEIFSADAAMAAHGAPDMMREALKNHREEIGSRMRTVIESARGQNPLLLEVRSILRQILYLDSIQEEIGRGEHALTKEEAEPPLPSPAMGKETAYAPAAMLAKMEAQEEVWKQELVAAGEAQDKKKIASLEFLLATVQKLMRGNEKERDYTKLLQLLLLSQVISDEEYKMAGDLLEARAKADELKGKMERSYVAMLKSMDPERLSPKDRERRDEAIREHETRAEEIFQLAADRRRGKEF